MLSINRFLLFRKDLATSISAINNWNDLTQTLRDKFLVCLPQWLKNILLRRHRQLRVTIEDTAAQLTIWTGSDAKILGKIEQTGNTHLIDLLEKFNKESKKLQTILFLPKSFVLIRTVNFPTQVRASLPKVIRYELDRLSPFQANEIIYDFTLRPNPIVDNGRIFIDLALARRDTVTAWIKRLTDLGTPVDRIDWEGAWPRANLLPIEERPQHHSQIFTINRLFALIIFLLTVAILTTPLIQKNQTLDILRTEIQHARTQSKTVDDLKRELDRVHQSSTAVLQHKLNQPSIAIILRELTDHLNDDTWIQNLEYNDGEVELRGESSQATALLALLSVIPGIDSVAFKSPLTQVARTGKERFNISFHYKVHQE